METAQKKPIVYLSNQLEQLGNALGESLFQMGSSPLKERLVLIPHPILKQYLNFFFASDPKWAVSAGVEYKTLVEGILSLVKEKKILSQGAISFLIESHIRKILLQKEDPFYQELSSYIASGLQGKEQTQKIIWLSEELSRIFYEYRISEPQILKEWLAKEGWKQELWRRVFFQQGNFFEALFQAKKRNIELHIFGFAHIPSHFYDFFSILSPTFYFLSPCEMFWEDLCSDKERIFLEKKMAKQNVKLSIQKEMQNLVKKTHPLLANWGRIGREQLTRFEESGCHFVERYEPISSFNALTMVQKSLLSLDDEREKVFLSLQDTSLLLLSAPSPLREVEVLLATLQELMHKDKVEPKDVIVLSPNLDLYLPYIHTVFGGSSFAFPYSVHGIYSLFCSEVLQEIEFFFSLMNSRFDKSSVLQFFSFPSVSKTWNFTALDLDLIKKWVDKAHVLWGFSLEHKRLCLQKNKEEENSKEGTWEEGLKKMILSLAREDASFPMHISLLEASLLGRFVQALRSLQEDARPVYEEKKLSFDEWLLLMRKWLSTYFGDIKEKEELLLELKALQRELFLEPIFLTFSSFKRAVDAYSKKKQGSLQSANLQAVKFLPLHLGGAYPAKIVYVLGCDEESFPKKQPSSCLDDMARCKKTPSLPEQNRYLLLELILHAKSSLVFSYVGISLEDQKKQGPSRLVQELMDYLDTKGEFLDLEEKPSKVFTRHHPALSFAKSYFQKDFAAKGLLLSSLLLAKSYYLQEKRELDPFFPSSIAPQENTAKDIPLHIEIRKIQDFAKNPTRFYLKERLEIFFDFIEPTCWEFFLPPIAKKQLKIAALSQSLEEGVLLAKNSGLFPKGEFSKISEKDLLLELQEWRENLQEFGLEEKDFFSVIVTDSVRKAEMIKEGFLCPPLVIEVEGVGKIALQGELVFSSQKGFLWPHKAEKEDLFTLWPTFLIFLCLARMYGWKEECFLLQKGKSLSVCVENPQYELSEYLRLYIRALKEPYLVQPKWILPLLFEDLSALEKKMNARSAYEAEFLDPYEQWLGQREHKVFPVDLRKAWKESLDKIFSPLLKEIVNKRMGADADI
jgi:exodeoxyribonuclease V gamma subunit